MNPNGMLQLLQEGQENPQDQGQDPNQPQMSRDEASSRAAQMKEMVMAAAADAGIDMTPDGEISDVDKDKVNKKLGLHTTFGEGDETTDIPGAAARNAQRNSERKSADKERGVSQVDPVVSTAHMNFVREHMAKSGMPVDEDAIKVAVESRLQEGGAFDMKQIAEDVSQSVTTKRTQKMVGSNNYKKALLESKRINRELKDLNRPAIQGQEGEPLTAPAIVNGIRKQQIAGSEMVLNVSSLEKAFDPKFFNRFTVLKNKSLAQMSKLGADLSPLQRREVSKFTDFSRQAVSLFNAYRKEITGAAASEQELKRLEKGFLNMEMSAEQAKVSLAGIKALAQMKSLVGTKTLRDANFLDNTSDYFANLDDIASDPNADPVDKKMHKLMQDWQKVKENVLPGLSPTQDFSEQQKQAILERAKTIRAARER